jgi:hypothetical protein
MTPNIPQQRSLQHIKAKVASGDCYWEMRESTCLLDIFA